VVLKESLLPADDLLCLLAHTPDLQALEILSGQPVALNNGFFRSLTIHNNLLSNILLCLTHFQVKGSYEFGTDSLLAMVESRTAGGSQAAIHLSKVDIALQDLIIIPERVRCLSRHNDIAVIVTGT
jgi:hypothetical protein